MAGRAQSGEIAFGSDSFMDVLANVVGILIILVIAAGIRAGHAAAVQLPPELPELDNGDLEAQAVELQDRGETHTRSAEEYSRLLARLNIEQTELAAAIEAREQDLSALRDERLQQAA